MNRALPVVLAGLVVAVVVGVWLMWPKNQQSSTSLNSSKISDQDGARLIIEGTTAESVQTAALSSEMRSTLPEHINLSMIQEIREKNHRKVLVFTDGSELELSPYLTSQLPSEVRLRLEYKRGEK